MSVYRIFLNYFNYCESNDNEQQTDKQEDVKRHQNHKTWMRGIRKCRIFLKNVFESTRLSA